MFQELEQINNRPKPFQYYTADELWTDEHTSKQMLEYHLNEAIDVSSRNINFIKKSVDWIFDYFNANTVTSIIDIGCGPGLYTTRLAGKGAQVTGIDFSKRSIDYAKKVAAKKGLDINYVNQNYLEFETDSSFDLVTMIMCDFCALSPIQRKQLLQKFNKFLKPGGSVLLDVYTINAFNQREEQSTYELNQLNSFWSPEKYYGFVNTFKYEREKVTLDKYTIVESNRTRVVYNWLQHFSKESLINEFQENGFSVKQVFANVAGDAFDSSSNEMAIVATRL
jgi:2-polyprenyl-3-methyl-5-hydroxy-6-metoxy-1,4-benzoquinol methylase